MGAELWKENVAAHADERLVGPRGPWWFTGVAPGECPGTEEAGVMSSLPLPDLATCGRPQVLDYFDNTWTLQEVLFAGLQTAEAFYRPPGHNLRHPLIFYYGHPAVLYVNKFRVAGLLTDPVNTYLEDILETGVDEMSWDDLSKNEMRWPAVTEVHAYRATVRSLVRAVIEETDFAAELGRPVTMDDRAWAVFMGFEHDRIHLETSSVLIRELPLRLVQRHPAWPAPAASTRTTPDGRPGRRLSLPVNDLIEVPPGEAVVGKPRDFPSYGWDNEYGQRSVPVPTFRAARHLASNGEYYAFVEDGGYREPRFWSEQGWAWRSFRNAKWPRFWMPHGPAGLHAYRLRTVFDEVDMPWDAPVCVNYHEAKAYCAWRAEKDQVTYRLISEAEHHLLREPSGEKVGPDDDPVMRHSGTQLRARGTNLNLAHGSESPVDASAPTTAGFTDVFGNVWQWCEDHANALPGFQVHSFYDDFSTPCFDGQHQMILGGSFVSTGDEASIWARFHFRPHFLQHSGIRLAVSAGGTGDSATRLDRQHSGPYETDSALAQYLLLHYGTDQDCLGSSARLLRHAHGFPQRVARLLLDTAQTHGVHVTRALDLGCAVGGSTFELSTRIDDVVGVDAGTRFIDTARELARTGHLVYQRTDQGERTTTEVATTDPTACRRHVRFEVADACALPADLGRFDAVLVANLLCRLNRPRACLAQFLGESVLIRPGGLLLLATPWSWSPEYTAREEWLGATAATGSSEDVLQEILSVEYDLVLEADDEVVLRDHERRFQYIRPQVTVWKRRTS
jgi:5-histidylcysteine sulfoxide synthase/putative 4-mercaptohistidine N1-methyltranferase